MINILKIHFSDLKAIFTHFFALVITLAVLVIPALYAWVNIYANWNPYANTGNVTIALASEDEGYVTESGKPVNKGQELVEKLASSTSIHWVVVDDPGTAAEGVRSGRYYGALVFGRSLSRNMYDMTAAISDQEPCILFYQNAKTNAIANKITNTAASSAEHNIQVEYIAVLIEQLLTEVQELTDEVDAEGGLDALIEMLAELRDSLQDYSAALGGMKLMDASLGGRLEQAGYGISYVGIPGSVFDGLESATYAVADVKDATLFRLTVVQDALTAFTKRLDAIDGEEVSADVLLELIELLGRAESALRSLRDSMPSHGEIAGMELAVRTMDMLLKRIRDLEAELQLLYDGSAGGVLISASLAELKSDVGAIQGIINENLCPAIELIFDGLVRDLELIYAITGSVNTTIGDIPPVFYAASSSVNALQGTANQLRVFLDGAANGTDRLLQRIMELRDNEKLRELAELLRGDPEEFALFLSQPVLVVTESVYPAENYGSAMTPFYSTLAIWVGGVVLTAIFKVEAEGKQLRRVKERQLFWGRYLLFFFLGQIQAAIIVWGDLHLLGCQCVEPGLFYLCASVTAFVFDTLIYSFALAFGDVGKAIVVVVMIVQIAGSSGSYPIEILPPIFSQIYLFFPFPYAINAMRESVFGLYEWDICRYLAELGIFGVLGLLVGLVVRRHFVGVNRFIEEEMEQSGVL